MSTPSGNLYTLGKGRLFFDQFAAGTKTLTGERYFGSTPNFNLTSAKTSLDHISMEGGIGIKDAAVDLTITRSGKFATDNVSKENIALFFLGSSSQLTQTAQTGVSESMPVIPGLFFQLGRTVATPSGVRNITNLVIKNGTTTIPLANNFVVDLTLGRIYTEVSGPDLTNVTGQLTVTYDIQASTREIVISKNQSLYGALRFIADNPVGNNADYFLPYVKISPEGDYALKGEKWQEMGFSVDILKLDANTESVYVDGRPGVIF